MPPDPNLEPRKDSQALSGSELHKKILDATVELFVEAGYSQITTNLIAERANVSVGSVYRFYPNKFAIFNAVVQNFFAAVDRTLEDFLLAADPDAPWDRHIDQLGEQLAALWQENRMLIRAWGVLSGNPEIAKADDTYATKTIDRITGHLPAIAPDRSQAEYDAMSRLIYWTTLHVFDTATFPPDAFDQAIIAEYKAMLKAYIRAAAPGN